MTQSNLKALIVKREEQKIQDLNKETITEITIAKESQENSPTMMDSLKARTHSFRTKTLLIESMNKLFFEYEFKLLLDSIS